MDEGDSVMGLSHKDFFNASQEKQKEVWNQLSEHERFLVRCSTPPGMNTKFIPCNSCKHRGEKKCKAFPDGLTGEIITRKTNDPYGECANKIFYEKK